MKYDPTKGLMKGDSLVCPFGPVLVGVIKEIMPEGKTRRKYKVMLRFPDGSESSVIEVKNLGKINFFDDFGVRDVGITSSKRAVITDYLQNQYSEAKITKQMLVTGTGLISVEPLIYVFDRKTVIADESVMVVPTESVPEFPGGEYSREEILAYLDCLLHLEPGVSDVLFLSELVSKIKPIFELAQIEVDFFTVLCGFPGTFKSGLAKLICYEAEDQLQRLTNISNRQLQKVVSTFKGHTVIADDYHKYETPHERGKQKVVLDYLGRNGGYRGGAYIVATGEYLEGAFSLQDRMLPIHTRVIEPEQKAEFSKKLKFLQDNRTVLWQFFREFCEVVYRDIEAVRAFIKKELVIEKYETIFRIERNTQFLVVAYNIMKFWYLKDDIKDWDTYIGSSLKDVRKEAIEHMQKVQRLQYSNDWVQLVSEIIPQPTMMEDLLVDGYYFSDGYWYVKKDKLVDLLEQALECRVPLKEVIRSLISNNILYTDNSSGNTVKRKKGKGVYAISIEALTKYIEKTKCQTKF